MKIRAMLAMAALVAVVCTGCPVTAPVRYQPGPQTPVWLAGDSIAYATYQHLESYLQIHDATQGGNGFVRNHRGTIQSVVFDRIAASAPPRLVIVEGSTNDPRNLEVQIATMQQFESDLAALGVEVLWLTTPVGPNLVGWLDRTNDWMRSQGAIDCDTPEVRAAGTVDGVHPTEEGYRRYAACIDEALVEVLAT